MFAAGLQICDVGTLFNDINLNFAPGLLMVILEFVKKLANFLVYVCVQNTGSVDNVCC